MSIELGLLANIFNELSRMGLLNVSHISDVVNLTGATTDYELQVGQIAYISFTNVTNVPLHIATPNNSYYELHVIPSNTGLADYRTTRLLHKRNKHQLRF